jgi:uncharacterized protein YceH (UPF0502 family)
MKIGSELAKLIPEWAVKDKSGCDCKSWVRKMNNWGEFGVKMNREAIITHLTTQEAHTPPSGGSRAPRKNSGR